MNPLLCHAFFLTASCIDCLLTVLKENIFLSEFSWLSYPIIVEHLDTFSFNTVIGRQYIDVIRN